MSGLYVMSANYRFPVIFRRRAGVGRLSLETNPVSTYSPGTQLRSCGPESAGYLANDPPAGTNSPAGLLTSAARAGACWFSPVKTARYALTRPRGFHSPSKGAE